MKTEGELQHRLKNAGASGDARPCRDDRHRERVDPVTHPSIATRWFSFPNIIIFSPVPLLVVATTWVMIRVCFGTRRTHRRSCSRSCCCSWAILVSDQPVAEHHSTGHIDQGSRRTAGSMGFTLVGALFVIPFILAYTAMSYYVIPRKGESRRGVSLMNAHPSAVARHGFRGSAGLF